MVKIAMIGAGFMGRTHGAAYRVIEEAALVAVCDSNEQQGRALAAEEGIPWFSDAREMLASVETDVLDICVPTFLHEGYALLGAEFHKHIFCEKPVTLQMDSLERMIAAAEQAGVQFAVGQAVRFWPEYVAAKKLYDAGAFGTIKLAQARRRSIHPKWSEWYRRAENSGGGLFDLHLHDIDYLCYLFGKVKQVYSVGVQNSTGCWNHVSSTLTFENGVNATAEGVIEMPSGYQFTMELTLIGDKKALEYRMVAGDNLENVGAAVRSTRLYGEGETPVELPVDYDDAYTNELAYFVRCLDRGEPITEITPTQVRHVLAVILAIRRSLETGEIVKLKS